MNKSFRCAADELSRAKDCIERLFEEGQEQIGTEGKHFEDKQAYYILQNILDNLDTAVYKLRRYSWPTIMGKLQLDPEREKFELIRSDTGRGIGWEFSCGDYIEVYDDDSGEWYPGRVEHTTREQKGYYFYNNELNHPRLYEGMKARVRKELYK